MRRIHQGRVHLRERALPRRTAHERLVERTGREPLQPVMLGALDGRVLVEPKPDSGGDPAIERLAKLPGSG